MVPSKTAVRAGDSYYLVGPERSAAHGLLTPLKSYLLNNLPAVNAQNIQRLG